MTDLIFYIFAGSAVGLAVGLTGVGGGSLMTPLLILWGIPEKIAIGTDLLYAAATKSGALYSHSKRKNVNWRLVGLLAAGSIPASIATTIVLKSYPFDYSGILTYALGYMLILTGLIVILKNRLSRQASEDDIATNWVQNHASGVAFTSGIVLGVVVTLSSVGAGAFCTALLLTLYPRMPAIRVVGTDIAHAVPLTFIAGVGHIWMGNVNWSLLAGLLIGSLPAVHFGSQMATKVPNSVLQPILATLLMIIGVKFAFF